MYTDLRFVFSNVAYLGKTLEYALTDLRNKVLEGWAFCAFGIGPQDEEGKLEFILCALTGIVPAGCC